MNDLTKYIKGQMTDAELERISERFILAKLNRDKRKDWSQQLKSSYQLERDQAKPSQKFNKSITFLISIAAGLLLLLAFFFLLPTNNQPQYLTVVDQHIAKLSMMADQSILRKGAYPVDELRKKATLLYLDQQYEKSIQSWLAIEQLQQGNGSDYFYLGLCYFKKPSPEPQQTIAALLKARTLDGPQEEIDWVLALAYLKNDNPILGKTLLEKIVREKQYQLKAAKDLLQLLE